MTYVDKMLMMSSAFASVMIVEFAIGAWLTMGRDNISQTECGCTCHSDEFPRYAKTNGISACSWCIGLVPGWNKCGTVRDDEEAEEQAVKLEYMKGTRDAKT